MKLIPLSQGQFAMIDDEDFYWVSAHKWYAGKNDPSNYYAVGALYRLNGKQKMIKMHRLVLGLNDPKIFCDHIDGNTLNNQRHNLRVATSSQNNANRKPNVRGSSKYLGVSKRIRKRSKGTSVRWQAAITKDRVLIYLGCFKTEEDAAISYNNKAKEIHGEFVRLNIID